ncbi:MAG: DUF4397 domain-containing protein [bacterium]|nr:DUF4397 domain-containing protein [bacterium]
MKVINFFKKSALAVIVLTVMVSTVFFNGCNEDNPINPTGPFSYVMIVHASPDAPNVDVIVNNTTVATNVPYLSNSQYLELTPGTNRVRINATGTSVTVIDTTTFYQENRYYSFFAADSRQSIRPFITTDDLTSPGSTNASIRFVHISPNTGQLDAGAVQKVQAWFPFYNYLQDPIFRPVTGGVYDLQLELAGQPVQVALLPGQTIAAGSVYTMMAVGFTGAGGNQALKIKLIKNR